VQIYQPLTVSESFLTLDIVWSQKQDKLALKLSRHVPIRVCFAHVVVSLALTSSAALPNLGGSLPLLHVLISSGWLSLCPSVEKDVGWDKEALALCLKSMV